MTGLRDAVWSPVDDNDQDSGEAGDSHCQLCDPQAEMFEALFTIDT